MFHFSSKYTYFEGEFGTRVLAFGFLFDFTGNGDLSVVNKVEKEIREPWFKEALTSHKPDVIALIGHTGLRFNEFKAAIAAIRQYYPYLPIAVLGGHTHIRDFAVYDAWAAGIESGRYMETIGFYSIDVSFRIISITVPILKTLYSFRVSKNPQSL